MAMYGAMREAVLAANDDPEIRAIVITGTEDCFTAGNDLADFQQRASREPQPNESSGLQMIEALMACATPVIAARSAERRVGKEASTRSTGQRETARSIE